MSNQKVARNQPSTPSSMDDNREAQQLVDAVESAAHATRTVEASGPGVDPDGRTEALQVVDLSKTFRSGFLRRRSPAIKGISFTVPRGGVFALLGHNGAGKTTTINCILDLVHPDRGHARIMGRDHRDRKSRTCLGYLPERPYFFDHLTGRELLQFYAQLLEVPHDIRAGRIDEVLARTGMTKAAGRRLGKCSKGMLQRIGLAQALVADPELLILDEPMSGLDPLGRREVRELLQELHGQGKTIILSSHIVPDIEMLADEVAILARGKLMLTRPIRELTGHQTFRVDLSRPATRHGDPVWPDWLMVLSGGTALGRDDTSGQVTVAGTTGLRELMNRCQDANIQIGRIEPMGTGLEDLFLAATREAEPVKQEAS